MQNGVNIYTKDCDLKVEYGLFDFGEERELARSSLRYILTDMNDIRKSYIRLGFHLSEFVGCEYYKDFGYDNIEEFSKFNLGMDKGAISRCVNVFREFSRKNDSGTCTMFLDERYANYNYSQLCEMVSLDDEKRKLVKPDMTIKQIRELKKSFKEPKEENLDLSVATSQPKLCIADFCDKKGIVLMNHIKKCIPDSSFEFVIYDSAGRQVECVEYDLLLSTDKKIYLRQKTL